MKNTKLAIALAVLSLAAAIQGLARAESVTAGPGLNGAWSNVKVSQGDDPHASGIEVEIRKHDGALVGFLTEYVGPVADPPVGKLESIRYDEKTGAISFISKLSVGVAPAPGGNAWIPTRNAYEFKGAIGKSGLTGILRRKSVQEDGPELAYEETVVLKTKTTADGESFQDWMKRWNDALKARGPKW